MCPPAASRWPVDLTRCGRAAAKQGQAFGLVKLAALELDGLHTPPVHAKVRTTHVCYSVYWFIKRHVDSEIGDLGHGI